MAYSITDKCIGCTLCAKNCPAGAIDGKLKEKHTVDPGKCIGCGLCGKLCARGAILDPDGKEAVKVPKSEWPKPVFLRGACTGCSTCIMNCPMDAIEIEPLRYKGDISTIARLKEGNACIGCGICKSVCPLDAVRMSNEKPNIKQGGFSMGKVFARVYQGVFSLAMYALPWSIPKQITGAGSIRQLPGVIKAEGIGNVLIVTDGMLMKLGLLNALFEELEAQGIAYTVFDKVQPNPTDTCVEEGVALFREKGCKALIAFGGGSPMDCAKGIGARIARPKKSIPKLQGLLKVLKKIPYIYAVPTTAGTGSETTIAAVITEEATHHKASLNDTSLMPHVAVLDPELTKGLPPKVTSTTGMDALCHAVESYTNHAYNTKLEDEYAIEAVKLIHDNLLKAYEDGGNLEARQNMQIAAFKAGRSFTRGCVGYVHAVGHTLGGLYGVPHGLAMSVILPHVLRQFGETAHYRLARLAEACGMEGATDAEKAAAFIAWIDDMKVKMSIPDKFENVIKDEDIPQIIAWARKEANPLYPTPDYWNAEAFELLINTIRV